MSKKLGLTLGLLCLVSILSGCASMKMALEADQAFNAKDYKTASDLYEQIYGSSSGWKGKIKLGYAYIMAERYDNAIAVLSELSKGGDSQPWALYYLGLAYVKKVIRN